MSTGIGQSTYPGRVPADAPDPTVTATGLGSWPGDDVGEALHVVRGELASGTAPEGVLPVPYLPELPGRGPGADLAGRAAHLLVDLPVDLQPRGWRLVDRPGRDHERAGAWWRQDLDELAESFEGYAGPLKVQVAGPWTLAASLWLPTGDRVLSDLGATRDLTASLAEGAAAHVTDVRRLVPGAEVVLQVDEPSISAVSLGRVRSDSGFRVLRTPETGELVQALAAVVQAARDAGAVQVVGHSCAADVPLHVLRQAGLDAISLDVARLDRAGWEEVAGLLDGGMSLWAGVLPTDGDPAAYRTHLEELVRAWREPGLPLADLARVAVSPACGLAGLTPARARELTAATVTAAAWLAQAAHG